MDFNKRKKERERITGESEIVSDSPVRRTDGTTDDIESRILLRVKNSLRVVYKQLIYGSQERRWCSRE